MMTPKRKEVAKELSEMTASEVDAYYGYSGFHEHKFKGGPPPLRIYRMGLLHEGRARRAGLPWDMVDLRLVYQAYDGKCGICRQPVEYERFTIDHIVPLSKGGGHLFENLQPSHGRCNAAKGGR